MISVEGLIAAFGEQFGEHPPPRLVRAPGRVNLIGEHTDYNDGFVLPMAIDRAVWLVVRPRDDRQVIVSSLDFGGTTSFSLDEISHNADQLWSNYLRGVAWALQEQGYRLRGMEGVIAGDVPIGAGLSSSAATEVAAAKAFQVVSGFDWDGVTVALACQRAENEFVGMRCGIMDQFIAVLGQRGHALLIDCRSLAHELVPLPTGLRVVVADTMKRRGLVDSEYNLRRQQCEEGVERLQEHLPGIRALRDVSSADLVRYGHTLPEVVRRRCMHVVQENERVLRAVAALREGDAVAFGRLMNASHASLRDLYEVSCRELDLMVEIARSVDGCLGARMTGAGFGGCTVNLVEEGAVSRFQEIVRKAYERQTGLAPHLYVCAASEGAGEVEWKAKP